MASPGSCFRVLDGTRRESCGTLLTRLSPFPRGRRFRDPRRRLGAHHPSLRAHFYLETVSVIFLIPISIRHRRILIYLSSWRKYRETDRCYGQSAARQPAHDVRLLSATQNRESSVGGDNFHSKLTFPRVQPSAITREVLPAREAQKKTGTLLALDLYSIFSSCEAAKDAILDVSGSSKSTIFSNRFFDSVPMSVLYTCPCHQEHVDYCAIFWANFVESDR